MLHFLITSKLLTDKSVLEQCEQEYIWSLISDFAIEFRFKCSCALVIERLKFSNFSTKIFLFLLLGQSSVHCELSFLYSLRDKKNEFLYCNILVFV